MIDISIIIPTFNSERTIKRALDSCLNTTLVNYEIIVVDDGSNDNTLDIVRSFKNKHIKILPIKHGGAGNARNKAILVAKGRYILFVDSDDELLINASLTLKIRNLVNLDKYDIINVSPISVDKYEINLNDKTMWLKILKNNLGIVPESKNFWIPDPYSKLYMRDFLLENNIGFSTKIVVGEDMVFNAECLKYAKRIFLIKDTFYKVNVNYNSVTHKILKKNFFKDNILLIDKLKGFISNEKLWNVFLFKRYFMFYVQLLKSDCSNIEILKELLRFKKYFDIGRINFLIFKTLIPILGVIQATILLVITISPSLSLIISPFIRRFIF